MLNWQRRCAVIEAVLFTFAAAAIGAERPDDFKQSVSRSRQVDPDLGDRLPAWEPAQGGVSDVTAATNCTSVGSFTLPSSGTNRFRGDSFHFDAQTTITEIKMELAFSGTTDLFVSIHQRLGDGTYQRINGFDVRILGASGQGGSTPKFYSTANTFGQQSNSMPSGGITLSPGDYAIGFAWSPSITYARDNDTYPKDFSRGQILGLVSANGVALPVPATTDFGEPFTGGAYSMQLCLLPVAGACCSVTQFGSEGCRDVPPDQCNAFDAVFHGELTSCADTPCNFGVCCDSCGGCHADLAPEACTAIGGVKHLPGLDACPADVTLLCPKTIGACCTDATCVPDKCKGDCDAIEGVYQGDGTTCGTPNVCAGACCISGVGCSDLTKASCTVFHGTFKGNGTTCNALLPGSECGGSCCFQPQGGQTTCTAVANREDCRFDAFPKTEYLGDTLGCGACDFASPQSCCAPDGTCLNVPTSAICLALGGDVFGTAQCTETTCVRNACCFTDGSCKLMTHLGCTNSGGTPDDNQPTCPAGFCTTAIPTGACCGLTAGACAVTTQAQCGGGIYLGDGTNCDTPAQSCPGFGACCHDGACLERVTHAYCTLVNGNDLFYSGDGNPCDPDCSSQVGVCCTSTAVCLTAVESECLGLNPPGKFLGNLSGGCDPDPCNVGGACCRMNGSCDNVLESACDGPFDIFVQLATCPIGCPPRGACCTSDGQCIDAVTSAICTATPPDGNGGLFVGVGTLCSADADLCKLGGCCDDTVIGEAGCTEKPKFQCRQNGLDFRGPGVMCAESFCGEGACCIPGNPAQCQVLPAHGQSPLGCLDRIGTVFSGNGVACEADTCVAGACCLPGLGQCQSRTRQSCELSGGNYLGAATTCAPSSCNFCTQSIKSSSPATCDIDAGQPHDPSNASNAQGLASVQITFNCDTTGMTKDDFMVTSTGGSGNPSPTPPTITQTAQLPAKTLAITLSNPIPAGAYTCVTHIASQTFVCFGSLPGDVDDNLKVAESDLCTLIGNLSGIPETALCTPPPASPLSLDKCDLDRSGSCTPLDILTAIDLFTGGQAFSAWQDATLPTCPTPGP